MTLIQNVNVTKPSSDVNDMSLFKSPPDAPKLPSVSVSPSAEIVEGSSVTLTCSSDANPAANYTWHKENGDSPKASGQIFTITDFRAEHSGNYYCEAQNRRGRHNSTLQLTGMFQTWWFNICIDVCMFSVICTNFGVQSLISEISEYGDISTKKSDGAWNAIAVKWSDTI